MAQEHEAKSNDQLRTLLDHVAIASSPFCTPCEFSIMKLFTHATHLSGCSDRFIQRLGAMLAEEVASCLPAAKLAAVTRNECTGDIYGVPSAESLRVISAFFLVPSLSAKLEF